MKKAIWLVLIGLLIISMLLVSCKSSTDKIRVATDATWAPFEYMDNNNNIIGFDIDVMTAIAEKQNLNIEFVNVAWDPLLAGMAQGTYDCAISSITITEDRKKAMLFSDPYFVAGQMIIVAKDNTAITSFDTLTGTVGAQLGTTGEMEAQNAANVTVKSYDEIGLAFQDLMNGQINAIICDSPVAQNYVKKNQDKLKIVGDMLSSENYGIAVAKGKTDLLNKINAGITAIKAEGLIEELSAKWLQ
ncbi:MAG: basic amino acid ABC transporter substrate-binding protein [Dehalococcoidales bacterium]|nr:basic amino acid ABC transporter substrate-binding protein [Dehalococcoidales bacterium]